MSKQDTGVVAIHGKEYKTVALRIQEFRELHPNYSIETEVLGAGDLVQTKTTIRDEAGRVLATGLAEELRGSTNINKTSALENAETSAVGRALAFLGLGGTEIASADEVANAITQQAEYEAVDRLKAHNAAVRDNLPSILAIKEFLAQNDYYAAYECYQELDDDTKAAITLAPTKGGIFTTGEVKQIRSDDWSQARKEFHNLTEESAA